MQVKARQFHQLPEPRLESGIFDENTTRHSVRDEPQGNQISPTISALSNSFLSALRGSLPGVVVLVCTGSGTALRLRYQYGACFSLAGFEEYLDESQSTCRFVPTRCHASLVEGAQGRDGCPGGGTCGDSHGESARE